MHFSELGYLPESPDRHRPYNYIGSDTLTMHRVPHDISAIASTGERRRMKAYDPNPYHFPGATWVLEIPIRRPTAGHAPRRVDARTETVKHNIPTPSMFAHPSLFAHERFGELPRIAWSRVPMMGGWAPPHMPPLHTMPVHAGWGIIR